MLAAVLFWLASRAWRRAETAASATLARCAAAAAVLGFLVALCGLAGAQACAVEADAALVLAETAEQAAEADCDGAAVGEARCVAALATVVLETDRGGTRWPE